MKVPELSHGAFLYLSAFMDGRTKTRTDVCKMFGSTAHGGGASQSRERRLLALGLLRLVDDCERRAYRPKPGKRPQVGGQHPQRLVITDAGRAAWREHVDFYLWAAHRFGGRSAGAREGVAR